VRRSDKRGARPATSAAAAAATGANPVAAAPKARPSSAKPRAKAKLPAAASVKAAPKTAPRRTIPPAGYASPTSHPDADQPPASADLIGTAVQAAGELAQIGFAVGRQALQSMLDRLPKP
jgi:hypothetical protein